MKPLGMSAWTVSCDSTFPIGLNKAWQFTRGDSSVVLAFIDGGVDMQHRDLYSAFVFNPGEDVNQNGVPDICSGGADINHFDDDGNGIDDDVQLGYRYFSADSSTWYQPAHYHGTPVAGLLAATTNNYRGIASPAGGDSVAGIRGVRIIPFSSDLIFTSSFLSSTFHYAMEYGARVFSSSVILNLADADSVFMVSLSLAAQQMLFIQATGNADAESMGCSFARQPDVMAVGGYDCTGGRWIVNYPATLKGSNYGKELALLGPAGDNGPATVPRMLFASTHEESQGYQCPRSNSDGLYDCFGGTSAAAPTVAAVAALILSYANEHDMDLTPQHVRKLIERTAEDVQCDVRESGCPCANPDASCSTKLLGWDRFSGYGRVDVGRAFTLPVAALDLPCPYCSYVVPSTRVHLTWECLDLVPENGALQSGNAHLELHYREPGDTSWVAIADSMATSETSRWWDVPDLARGEYGYIRLSVVDSRGNWNYDFRRIAVKDSADVAGIAGEYRPLVREIYPNPSNGVVKVTYELPSASRVSVSVYDVSGRRIRVIHEKRDAPGTWTSEWNGHDDRGQSVSSGVYFVRVENETGTSLARLVLLR